MIKFREKILFPRIIPVNVVAARTGNIGPYLKDMWLRVSRTLPSGLDPDGIVVLVTIKKNGSLASSVISQSSGSKKTDKAALAAVEKTDFSPLPHWYRGDQLTLTLDLSKCKSQE